MRKKGVENTELCFGVPSSRLEKTLPRLVKEGWRNTWDIHLLRIFEVFATSRITRTYLESSQFFKKEKERFRRHTEDSETEELHSGAEGKTIDGRGNK
eukprot:gene16195-17823_t